MEIGVLDVQGSVEEHFSALSRLSSDGLDIEPVLVKRAEDFAGLDGLVIPGGESTTISKLVREHGLDREILALAKRGGKILGTCAGAILLARETGDKRVKGLGLIDVEVDRNAYGRQLDSFETGVEASFAGKRVVIPAVFIRAPIIGHVGEKCEVLASHDGCPVLVREGNVLISTFHPEMDNDKRLYEWFFDKNT